MLSTINWTDHIKQLINEIYPLGGHQRHLDTKVWLVLATCWLLTVDTMWWHHVILFPLICALRTTYNVVRISNSVDTNCFSLLSRNCVDKQSIGLLKGFRSNAADSSWNYLPVKAYMIYVLSFSYLWMAPMLILLPLSTNTLFLALS